MTHKSHLELPSLPVFREAFVAFVLAYARELEITDADAERLRSACRQCFALVEGQYAGGPQGELIAIDIYQDEGLLTVEVLNRGVPILLSQVGAPEAAPDHFAAFREISVNVDRISIENDGRRGQRLMLQKKLGTGSVRRSLPEQSAREKLDVTEEEISIRLLAPGEEVLLSQLFYFVYGYNYINEYVYYPEKLDEMIRSGRLISTVATLANGRLVAHVGLVRWNEDPPVYEAALGLVDPLVKSRGLFGRVFDATMERVQATAMHYCFFDFVTNHDYSQKIIAKYGTCDMALFAGCQRSSTQASLERLGIGNDPQASERYSLLLSIMPRTPHPFGEEIALPENIGGPLGFLLEPLGIRWVPTPRFAQLAVDGQFRARYHSQQDAAIFDLHEPGRRALEAIVADWQALRRSGFRYAAVEVPVDVPGLGQIHDFLSANGFFIAGFIPYALGGRLGFRFQSMGPAKLAFPEIKVATPSAKKLLDLIQRDHERTALV